MKLPLCCLLLCAPLLRAEPPAPDWPRAEAETLKMTADLVRLDTSNPPGNEVLAAEYLRGALAREGIDSKILTSTGTRSSLVARLKGSGKKRPLLLMCHTDVVPAEAGEWSVDPFGAEIKDGYLYGRGTADIKSMCAAEAAVLFMLKRSSVPLDRDVIFLAQADEESGGADRHVDWLVANHWDELDAEYGINEGGFTHWDGTKIPAIDLQCGEKQYLDLRLVAKGTSGHSSMPHPDNAVHALVRALARLAEHTFPLEISPLSIAYLETALAGAEPELKRAVKRLRYPSWREPAETIVRLSPKHEPVLRDTCAATILKAGYKSNVVPESAEAVVNCRLLPGRTVKGFLESLRGVIKEPAVEILSDAPDLAPAPPMPIDGELVRAVTAAARENAPGAPVRPYMAAWSTDSLIFRSKGVKVYGLDPPLTEEDGERTHGRDERVPIAGLNAYLRLLYAVVLRLSVEK